MYTYIKALEEVAFSNPQNFTLRHQGKRLLETQENTLSPDLGLRHTTMGYRDNDIGGMLENVVFLELLRRKDGLYTLENKGSLRVDFVAALTDELYVQVCYILTEDNTKREFEPFRR